MTERMNEWKAGREAGKKGKKEGREKRKKEIIQEG